MWEEYPEDDDFDYEGEEQTDELEEALMNCGKMRDGSCMMAGSEQCDFECPFRE